MSSNTLPAKFATMFEGEPNKVAQRIARDTKFIDACFEVSSAPYNRFVKVNGEGKSPFEALPIPANLTAEEQEHFENKEFNARVPPQFISKLAHVCLQRLFEGLEPNQEYFSKRECLMLKPELGRPQPVLEKWTSVISNQSEDPLGATVTLSKLLGSNARISESIVNEDLLKQFLELISSLGPQPRLIQLFSSVCVVAGKCITSNQEMVLRMLWMDEVARTASILKLVGIPQREKAAPVYGGFDKGRELRREASTWLHDAPTFVDGSNRPFLGDEEFRANPQIDQVYVEWAGSPKWKEGARSDALFWDWQALRIPKESQGVPIGSTIKKTICQVDFQISQVPVEWLCWVLEPDRLCKPVTGMQYKPYNEVIAGIDERESHRVFQWQCQLADFFVSQLQLMTNLARGRSYNCITWLTGKPQRQSSDGMVRATTSDGFSYMMLIGMASNPWLPYIVRSSVIELLLTLYVDRYPQLANSGRPTLPEKLWIASLSIGNDGDEDEEEKEEEKEGEGRMINRRLPLLVHIHSSRTPKNQRSRANRRRTSVLPSFGRNQTAKFRMSELQRSIMVYKSVPVIHDFALTDDAALPKFKLAESHLFYEKMDEEDRYADPVLSIEDDFKFYLLRRLCNGIIESLDGGMILFDVGQNRLACAALSASSMLLDFGFNSSVDKIKQLVQPAAKLMDGKLDFEKLDKKFTPAQNRYRDTGAADYQVVVAAKKKVIGLLQTVSDYRANYRLARLLNYFQSDKELQLEMHDLYQMKYMRGEDMRKVCSESYMAKAIYLEFEKLFDQKRAQPDDATELDLAKLTKQPIGALLLDCAMYDDDSLFEEAIKLLGK